MTTRLWIGVVGDGLLRWGGLLDRLGGEGVSLLLCDGARGIPPSTTMSTLPLMGLGVVGNGLLRLGGLRERLGGAGFSLLLCDEARGVAPLLTTSTLPLTELKLRTKPEYSLPSISYRLSMYFWT